MSSPNFALSKHFSWWELTTTNNFPLLNQNRKEAEIFIDNLKALAILLEVIRPTTGPLEIHSGFRGPSLNSETPGSSKTSQHMKGEASDFSRVGVDSERDIDSLFEDCLHALIESGVSFGQLIREKADRPYGKSMWVHLSLGVPFREYEKCGQVMHMDSGKYTLIKTIPFGH